MSLVNANMKTLDLYKVTGDNAYRITHIKMRFGKIIIFAYLLITEIGFIFKECLSYFFFDNF